LPKGQGENYATVASRTPHTQVHHAGAGGKGERRKRRQEAGADSSNFRKLPLLPADLDESPGGRLASPILTTTRASHKTAQFFYTKYLIFTEDKF